MKRAQPNDFPLTTRTGSSDELQRLEIFCKTIIFKIKRRISAIIVSNYPRELEDLEDLDEDLEDREEELDLENQLLMGLVNKEIDKYFKHHSEQGLRCDQ